MIRVELTPTERQQLLVILDRVSTKGVQEAKTYLELYMKIQSAPAFVPTPPEDEEKEEE